MTLKGGIKGGKESSLNNIFLPFFFSPWEKAGSDLQWVVWLTMTEKTPQPTVCLLPQWLRCCLRPSLPCFAPEPTRQTSWQTILKLCLVSFLYQPRVSGITRAMALCFAALPAVPSPVPQQSEQTQSTPGAKCGSILSLELFELLPVGVSALVTCPWARVGGGVGGKEWRGAAMWRWGRVEKKKKRGSKC